MLHPTRCYRGYATSSASGAVWCYSIVRSIVLQLCSGYSGGFHCIYGSSSTSIRRLRVMH